jgi:hypothetical protein
MLKKLILQEKVRGRYSGLWVRPEIMKKLRILSAMIRKDLQRHLHIVRPQS